MASKSNDLGMVLWLLVGGYLGSYCVVSMKKCYVSVLISVLISVLKLKKAI